jgi:serine/threonine protein kinase
VSEPEKFGAYLVYELLGSGGMATVHRAESQSAGGFRKRVALKRLLPNVAEEPEIVESFTREAKLASHLHHANIAQTYDLGIVDGTYYIAMELVGGPTLRQLMWQCFTAAGAIPIEHAMCILVQMCEALAYAHQLADDKGRPLGIVHRDVSPANIIVSGSGVVKLIDFGLAKVRSSRGTKAGILKGKLSYMAPEYTLGQLDARADLFAVGIIAHELLTGRRLFDHQNDFEIINMLREMPIQPPSRWAPTVPHDLDDIVMTALQRNPANRWQSAQALHAALLGAAREQGYALAPPALAKWTEWAFTQKPRTEESGLARVIDDLGDASSGSIDRAVTNTLGLTPTPSPVMPELHFTPTPSPADRATTNALEQLVPPDVGAVPPKPITKPPSPPKPITRPPQPPTVVRPMPPELIQQSVPGKPITKPPRAPRPIHDDPSAATVVAQPPAELIAASAGYVSADTTSTAAGVFETLTPGIPPGTPATGVTTIPQDLIASTKKPPSARGTAIPPPLDQLPLGAPSVPTLDQLPLGAAAVPTLDQLPLTRAADPYATDGVPVAPAPAKRPTAPRRSRRWLLFLAVLVLAAGGVASAWYLGYVELPLLGLRQ